ncbi:hypothetical protein RchiOBHm_Chr4g0424531 [Rosa chinensis]|uniref:Uncharacterized protein n=1 Tax=Rosa chinensis TaxID=74649 RepID=A0A2P6QYX8_ROSCH|nr:hypothetical protein RchiOBHm_Chr4g0424531 [Rosa chinensis]
MAMIDGVGASDGEEVVFPNSAAVLYYYIFGCIIGWAGLKLVIVLVQRNRVWLTKLITRWKLMYHRHVSYRKRYVILPNIRIQLDPDYEGQYYWKIPVVKIQDKLGRLHYIGSLNGTLFNSFVTKLRCYVTVPTEHIGDEQGFIDGSRFVWLHELGRYVHAVRLDVYCKSGPDEWHYIGSAMKPEDGGGFEEEFAALVEHMILSVDTWYDWSAIGRRFPIRIRGHERYVGLDPE